MAKKRGMFKTKMRRIAKAGAMTIVRNGVVSVASILVMTITLFCLGALMIGSALLDSSLNQIRDKVDINVYFKLSGSQEDIFALKAKVASLPEVRKVEYLSRDDALRLFKERHKDNSTIMSALDELGENPLLSSLNIKTVEPSQYEGVAKLLEDEASLSTGGQSIIDKVNYNQNKEAIRRLAYIISTSNKLGMIITVIFAIIAIIVTYNTTRLAIYTSKEEIAIMKLVGASNNYVRGPFLIEGAICGTGAAILAMLILWPFSAWLGQSTGEFFGGVNIYSYFTAYAFQMFGIMLLVGNVLGIGSSMLAISRYLKV